MSGPSRRKRRNWWPVLLFLGILLPVSILLFARVRETEIELDASVSSVSFELAKEQVLTAAVDVASLGVSGLQSVQLPEAGTPPAPHAVLLSSTAAQKRTGTVTLAPAWLPSGTRISLLRADVPNQYRLSITPSTVALNATVNGPITVGFAGAPARQLAFPVPKPVSFRGGPEELSLDLTFASLPQAPFSPLLEVRSLSFLRVDEFPAPDRTIVRRLSTLSAGTLYFESLNGQERRLRPGENLTFQQCQGSIRTLDLVDRQIGVKFHGRASGMSTGSGEGQRSLMPTYLEWLQARHGLSLLWATSLYLFALIAGALRWWGVRI